MWESVRERWSAFTIEQKLSVIILSLCGIFAVVLSLYRVQESIRAPFLVDKNAILATKQLVGPSNAEEEARLKRIDTDGDGLSDWDETNVFHTNPNLKDTCGDGIPDNIRVTTGKNLACEGTQKNPGGFIDLSQVMGSATTATAAPVTGSSPLGPGLDFSTVFQSVQGQAGVSSTDGAVSSSDSSGLNGNAVLPRDPAQIRAALKGRVDPAVLQNLTDDQLLSAYDQAVKQYAQQSQQAPQTVMPTDASIFQ